ncbi:adenosylcobinamide kinase /adenosylcobinamide-phosphate guanylyltransferase [Selenomonas sp. GACV-9]|uniref:bifunctional adenosylcobinamide kinase/adenosylcobinamide-phosphate guanylyltransferase n=1 Tax=Selenomonas sp. GACV-9 TaxID=3158782 RepID=UPI0008E2DA2B|nr:adenosylcobinamide kinase /adenosylcobinamide-phosphate guanylyltransferase [Selenomonas ruminantium]
MSETETGRIVLVTGGARSGKSTFAENLAAKSGARVAYIATAQVYDEEMRFRVSLHQKRRPGNWQTYEAPFDAGNAIQAASEKNEVLLFDCITLYLSNLLCSLPEGELADQDRIYALTSQKIGELVSAAQMAAASGRTVIFVTNEVGAGIVPENKLSRIYRDISGLANQQLARAASDVFAVIAGIPVNIKALA